MKCNCFMAFEASDLEDISGGFKSVYIDFGVLVAEKIASYGYLPKTLNLTPPDLLRNPG
jgi:hypothetical protein